MFIIPKLGSVELRLSVQILMQFPCAYALRYDLYMV